MGFFLKNLIIISLLFNPAFSWGATENSNTPQIFDGFLKNVADSFSGTNLLFHGAGIGATPILINNGVDARVYASLRQNSNDAAWPGAVIGSGAVAAAAGLWLYWYGKSHLSSDEMGAAYVIAQASLITVSYVMFLKALTGRAHPANSSPLSPQEQSEDFIFGFKKPLTGYGWPSGHVSHTVAVTSALAHYYPDQKWLRWVSIGLSSYMLYTVSAFNSAQMHWFSDGIAGGFMGYAIGSTVGKNWRADRDKNSLQKTNGLSWYPLITPQAIAITTSLEF